MNYLKICLSTPYFSQKINIDLMERLENEKKHSAELQVQINDLEADRDKLRLKAHDLAITRDR